MEQQTVIDGTPAIDIQNLALIERSIYKGEDEPFDMITIGLKNGSFIDMTLEEASEVVKSIIGLMVTEVPEPALV